MYGLADGLSVPLQAWKAWASQLSLHYKFRVTVTKTVMIMADKANS